jgi:hypothetical protein
MKDKITKLRYDINEIKQRTFLQPEMLPEVKVISKRMISGNGQNKNIIDSNKAPFSNIQVSDSVVDQLNNEVAPSDNANIESLEDSRKTDAFLDEKKLAMQLGREVGRRNFKLKSLFKNLKRKDLKAPTLLLNHAIAQPPKHQLQIFRSPLIEILNDEMVSKTKLARYVTK